MKNLIVWLSLAAAASVAQAQVALECERYWIGEGTTKIDRSMHRFTLDPSRKVLKYENISGQPWIFPASAEMSVSWSSQDGLRVVSAWIAPSREGGSMEGPVHIADLDFSRLRIRVETFGGVIDFDQVISDPWKLECRRLN